MRLDVKLLNCVRGRADGKGIGEKCVVQHSIHRVVILLRPLPVDRWAHRTGSKLDGERPLLAALNQGDGAGSEECELVELAPIQRQLYDRRVADDLSLCRRNGVDLRYVGIDRDG